MSSASMAILTIGVVPVAEMLPLLTEHIREDEIAHISLLGKMTREDVMRDYSIEPGEEMLLTLLNDNQIAQVSRQKVERDLRSVIAMLDKQNYDLILLMSTHPLRRIMRSCLSRKELFRRWLRRLSTAIRWG